MQQIISTLILTSLLCLSSHQTNKLPNFNVRFISGCAAITESEINVYKKENRYYANHNLPTYFDGNKIDSVWTVELNEAQIDACNKFLEKAKSLPRKCERFSSIENHHIIFIEKDTIDINGDCTWDNLDFKFLDDQIFKKKHNELAERKKVFLSTLDKKLKGKWYIQSLQQDLTMDDIVTLSRNKVSENYFEFGNNHLIRGECKNFLNIKGLKRYETLISDGWNNTVINIDWGKISFKQDNHIWYDFRATFTLVQISNDELRLNFLWKGSGI